PWDRASSILRGDLTLSGWVDTPGTVRGHPHGATNPPHRSGRNRRVATKLGELTGSRTGPAGGAASPGVGVDHRPGPAGAPTRTCGRCHLARPLAGLPGLSRRFWPVS